MRFLNYFNKEVIQYCWVRYKKGEQYGFRIECPHSYTGLGKTVGSNSMPISINGQQWKLINMDPKGHYYSFFNLAYIVVVSA